MMFAAPKQIVIQPSGRTVVVVDREQLRFRSHKRMAYVPRNLKALPQAPPSVDWSRGEKIQYPILGNDRYGDCYYAAVAHAAQTFTGDVGTECQFDVNQLTQRYLEIAGGDNGLDDGTILPEWHSGIVGPNGPHKIFDELIITPGDKLTHDFAIWKFGGTLWTCSLPSGWANDASPGAVWDAHSGGSVGGHAMWQDGYKSDEFQVRTWGVSPPVFVTEAGLEQADPEIIVVATLDWFDPATGLAPDGEHYEVKAQYWEAMGGKKWPTSPFPPPNEDVDIYL